jgi:acyl-CoA synthetase (NDP forming)
MGFLNLADGIFVGGWPYKPPPPRGSIGFITHSGSSYSAFALNQRQLALSHLISAGQEIVTTAADYMHFLLSRPEVRVIGCILETARDPENFIAALERADRKGVPVVVLKLGRSAAGGKMARAHSGALAGSETAYRAVFERHNVLPVRTLNELADTLELLACPRSPTTDGVALATDSGGERTLIVDLAAEIGLSLAQLTVETTRRLAQTLDPGLAPINPVDAWGSGHHHERIMRTCLQALADDQNVGQVVLASNMLSGRPLLHAWGRVAEAVHRATTKPVVVMGHLTPAFDKDEAARLRGIGVPVLPETYSGLRALATSARWHGRRLQRRSAPPISGSHAEAARAWSERLARCGGASLDTADSLAMAAEFGIPVSPSRPASSLDEAASVAEALGYPVVLKTLAPGVDHKFDRGGVELDLGDREALAKAYSTMAERLGGRVLVQRQAPPGTEIFVGMTNDEQFGPIVTIGLGGVFVEIFGDTTSFLPPVERDEVLDRLSRLKASSLLQGARGRTAADLPALADAIASFSQLAAMMGGALAEMDVNPIIAGPSGCAAVDALAIPKP